MDTNRPDPNSDLSRRPRRATTRRAALLACALLAPLGACGPVAAPRSGAVPPARAVPVARADRSQRAIETDVVGTVRAVREASIAPLLGGTVAEVRVGIGAAVRAGDTLVRLSAREVEARLAQTQAVSALAARERDRAVTLEQRGAIPLAQYEAALSRWDVARAGEAEARTVAERQALRAPFAGVITAKLVEVGDTALPGQRLLVLEDRRAFRFEARVPATGGDDLRLGDRLPVRVEGLAGELEGRVAEIQPAADDATRTRLIKLDLPAAAGVRSGQFGRALLTTGRSLAVTIPAGAVARRGQLETVFVVEAGVARLRLVRAGRERQGRVEILAGLSGGEAVALVADLTDGERVR
jgi:RND family efflux transporter MFP subunit